TITVTRTPGACDPDTNYTMIASMGGTFVTGVWDIGNHCNACITTIALPFPFRFYGQTFTSANVSSKGNIQFISSDPSPNNVCLPGAPFSYAIMPYWGDLYTVFPL